MKKYLLFVLSFAFLVSCSSPRYILDKEVVSFNELLKNIQNDQDKLETLSGSCRISVDTFEFSGTFYANIFYNNQDSLLLDASGPFGINVGKMFIGKKRFIFLNNMTNQFYTGTKSEIETQNFLQFPIKIDELTGLVVARDEIKNMKIINYTIENNSFFIHGQNGTNQYNIVIDNQNGHIKKIEYIFEDKVVLIKEYDKFVQLNGQYFPKFIKLTKPEEKQSISLYYDKVNLNQPITPSQFVVKISDSARQIKLDLLEMKD